MTKIQSSYQSQLRIHAEQLRHEAETLPRGRARDALLRQAEKLESSAVVEGWVSASQLEPPKEEWNEPSHHQSQLDTRTSERTQKIG